MTRKHFEVIARLLAEARAESIGLTAAETIDIIAGDLAIAFAGLNPRFDTNRFIDATQQEV